MSPEMIKLIEEVLDSKSARVSDEVGQSILYITTIIHDCLCVRP